MARIWLLSAAWTVVLIVAWPVTNYILADFDGTLSAHMEDGAVRSISPGAWSVLFRRTYLMHFSIVYVVGLGALLWCGVTTDEDAE